MAPVHHYSNNLFLKIISLLIAVLSMIQLKAQINPTMNAGWTELINNGTKYQIKLQIKSNAPGENLGNAVFIFTYDTTNLSYPASPVSGTDYSFINFKNSPYTTPTVIRPNKGEIQIKIYLPTGTGTNISDSVMSVATITFKTKNSSGSPNITWAMTQSCVCPTMDDVYDDAFTNFDENSFIGTSTSALPVNLVNFAAICHNQETLLEWNTMSETNNAFFTIERGTDTKHFLSFSTVAGAGNSQSRHSYKVIDEEPLTGISYYRLKQTDFNGKSEEFNIVPVRNSNLSFTKLYAYFQSNNLLLICSQSNAAYISIKVKDIYGRELEEMKVNANKGENIWHISRAEFWKPGMYVISLYENLNVVSVKVIKN
jgi:hypothetical protein